MQWYLYGNYIIGGATEIVELKPNQYYSVALNSFLN